MDGSIPLSVQAAQIGLVSYETKQKRGLEVGEVGRGVGLGGARESSGSGIKIHSHMYKILKEAIQFFVARILILFNGKTWSQL